MKFVLCDKSKFLKNDVWFNYHMYIIHNDLIFTRASVVTGASALVTAASPHRSRHES